MRQDQGTWKWLKVIRNNLGNYEKQKWEHITPSNGKNWSKMFFFLISVLWSLGFVYRLLASCLTKLFKEKSWVYGILIRMLI